jgi:hypothetical protein
MARRPENVILYDVFKDFLRQCLLENHSLLWPDKIIWTLENVTEVKKRMVESPIMGKDLSFKEKLKRQMTGCAPEHWAIICDVYYVYFLPSLFTKLQTKQKDIQWAAAQGGLAIPMENGQLWDAQQSGFTRTGQRYNLKYLQFWLIMLLAINVKSQGNPGVVLASPQELQKTLDLIIESIPKRMDRAYDMRHAILYMAFPDHYERIISTHDKERILETYGNKVSGAIPSDLDEALYTIRKALSPSLDKPDRPFDYYQDLKEEWKPHVSVVKTKGGVVTVPEGEEEASAETKDSTEAKDHTKIQWLLLKLGNDMGLDVWVAKNDQNREFNGHKFTDLPHFKKEIPLTFDEASNRTIKHIDVVWLKGNAIKAAFEIESTTSIYSGLLRLADLIAMQPNIAIPLFIVAPDVRRDKVIAEVNRPVFSKLPKPMSDLCKYISFSSLQKKILEIASIVKHLSPGFLDDLAESCEVDEGE